MMELPLQAYRYLVQEKLLALDGGRMMLDVGFWMVDFG